MEKKRILHFGKIDYCGSGRRINELVLEVTLKDCETKKPVFSAMGMVWNSRHTDCVAGGQILDDEEIVESMKGNRLYNKVLDLWKRNHLNDMHAGTEEQEECLEKFKSERQSIKEELNKSNSYLNDYDASCKLLENHGLLTVTKNGVSYKYGEGWLYREISERDLKDIETILDTEITAEELLKKEELYK